jgi:hypothetical protein
MDRIGRKQTMCLGFACWAVLGFILGGALNQIQSVFALFVVLYGIFNSFGEMGPGVSSLFPLSTCTFVADGSVFRSRRFSAQQSPSQPPCEGISWVSLPP